MAGAIGEEAELNATDDDSTAACLTTGLPGRASLALCTWTTAALTAAARKQIAKSIVVRQCR